LVHEAEKRELLGQIKKLEEEIRNGKGLEEQSTGEEYGDLVVERQRPEKYGKE